MTFSRTLVFFITIASVACACSPAATPSAPHEGSSPMRDLPIFEFHSSFWLNLHLRLHYAATGRRPPPAAALQQPDAPEWARAVDFYKVRFGEKGGMGLMFDDDLVSIERRLSALDAAPLSGLDPALTAQLDAVASLARRDWPEQERLNRAWISAVEPALRRHGKALIAALSAAYHAPWPQAPILVDVSGFAGPFGAFTVLDPVHITISSTNPAYSGDASLEMIFHEASHALIEPIANKLEAEAVRRGRKVPEDLWHALIFYTTGEIVKRELGSGYVPYATKNGVWSRGWSKMETAIRRDWQPYLDGKMDLDRALSALMDELSEPNGQSGVNLKPMLKRLGVTSECTRTIGGTSCQTRLPRMFMEPGAS